MFDDIINAVLTDKFELAVSLVENNRDLILADLGYDRIEFNRALEIAAFITAMSKESETIFVANNGWIDVWGARINDNNKVMFSYFFRGILFAAVFQKSPIKVSISIKFSYKLDPAVFNIFKKTKINYHQIFGLDYYDEINPVGIISAVDLYESFGINAIKLAVASGDYPTFNKLTNMRNPVVRVRDDISTYFMDTLLNVTLQYRLATVEYFEFYEIFLTALNLRTHTKEDERNRENLIRDVSYLVTNRVDYAYLFLIFITGFNEREYDIIVDQQFIDKTEQVKDTIIYIESLHILTHYKPSRYPGQKSVLRKNSNINSSFFIKLEKDFSHDIVHFVYEILFISASKRDPFEFDKNSVALDVIKHSKILRKMLLEEDTGFYVDVDRKKRIAFPTAELFKAIVIFYKDMNDNNDLPIIREELFNTAMTEWINIKDDNNDFVISDEVLEVLALRKMNPKFDSYILKALIVRDRKDLVDMYMEKYEDQFILFPERTKLEKDLRILEFIDKYWIRIGEYYPSNEFINNLLDIGGEILPFSIREAQLILAKLVYNSEAKLYSQQGLKNIISHATSKNLWFPLNAISKSLIKNAINNGSLYLLHSIPWLSIPLIQPENYRLSVIALVKAMFRNLLDLSAEDWAINIIIGGLVHKFKLEERLDEWIKLEQYMRYILNIEIEGEELVESEIQKEETAEESVQRNVIFREILSSEKSKEIGLFFYEVFEVVNRAENLKILREYQYEIMIDYYTKSIQENFKKKELKK